MRPNPSQPRPLDPTADKRQRTWSQYMHLLGLLAAMPGVTAISLIATLAMWLIRKDESEFVDDHGREAVNFQISIFIYSVIGALFSVITVGFGAPVAAVAIGGLTLYGGIRAAQAAGRSEYFRYPMCIRFLTTPADAPASVSTPY